MKKILVLGISPIPLEKGNDIIYGQGIRTWQFVKPLLQEGHRICLVCLYQPVLTGINTPDEREKQGDNFVFYSLGQKEFLDLSFIQKIHDDFRPDCIVSTNSFLPSYMAAQLDANAPLWLDQNGDLMAEAQVKARRYGDNKNIYEFWNVYNLILNKGDVFSALSTYQKYALIGALGTQGRLSSETSNYEFVYLVPLGVETGQEEFVSKEKFIREKYAAKEDFIVLFSGSYNTWADVDTLFKSVEKSMAANPHIKFVSAGGAVRGHDEKTYPRILRLIEASKFKKRFLMLDWIPRQDLLRLYKECDICINIDKKCYEAFLGGRNRLLDCMRRGLPVLTTKTCELSEIIEKEDLGFVCPTGDREAISNILINLSKDRYRLKGISGKAASYIEEYFSYEKTTQPLKQWVLAPKFAPDRKNSDDLSYGYARRIESEYVGALKGQLDKANKEAVGLNIALDKTNKQAVGLNIALDKTNKEAVGLNIALDKANKEAISLQDMILAEKEQAASLKEQIIYLKEEVSSKDRQLAGIFNSRWYKLFSWLNLMPKKEEIIIDIRRLQMKTAKILKYLSYLIVIAGIIAVSQRVALNTALGISAILAVIALGIFFRLLANIGQIVFEQRSELQTTLGNIEASSAQIVFNTSRILNLLEENKNLRGAAQNAETDHK